MQYFIPAPSQDWEFIVFKFTETRDSFVSRLEFISKEKKLKGEVPIVVSRHSEVLARKTNRMFRLIDSAIKRARDHAANVIHAGNLEPL